LAIEEFLRFDGPAKIVVRRVRRTVEWHGFELKAGTPVFCSIMAANHDPNVFDRPKELILDRSPNDHLGFGWGRHFCLGSRLARLESQIAISRILERFPKLRLAASPESLEWQPTIVGRTLRSP
jgi:hypothetical protein